MSRDKRSYRSTQRTRRGAVTTFGSRTDVGCVRDHNEDSLVVAPPLFAVADGMGGHAAGEVASEIAVNVLAELAPKDLDGAALEHAVEEANHEIIRAARDGRGREGMGTTLTACMLENERLIIAQVGDSRAYLLHHGKLQQLTRDHSLMADMIEAGQLTPEEARHHPQRSVITRALGSDPNTRPDMYEINVETGDRLLVCSDGLSSMIEDEQIEAVMRRVPDPQRCASQLVNEAIAAAATTTSPSSSPTSPDSPRSAAASWRARRSSPWRWSSCCSWPSWAAARGACTRGSTPPRTWARTTARLPSTRASPPISWACTYISNKKSPT